jgi:Plasmid replication region DNA-binding N-term
MTEVSKPYGSLSPGVTAGDVERAADALLRAGERPTIEKIRAALKGGSPNTINPLLDAWWKRLSARLDSGPAALHRLPESVAHVAEALWMQALDEGRRRAQLELKSMDRSTVDQQQALDVRSHVLSLREGELDSRLRDRESTIAALNLQLRELTQMLRKEQATRDAQARRITALEAAASSRPAIPAHPRAPLAPRKRRAPNARQRTASFDKPRLARRRPPKKPPNTGTPQTPKKKPPARRTGKLRRPKTATGKRNAPKKRPRSKGQRR